MPKQGISHGRVYKAGEKFVETIFPRLLQKIGFSKQEAEESSATLGLFFGAASKYSAMFAVPAVTVGGLAVASVVSAPVLAVAATVAFAAGYGATGFFGAGVLKKSKEMYDTQEQLRAEHSNAAMIECEQEAVFNAENTSKKDFKTSVDPDNSVKKTSTVQKQNAQKFNR